jgi:Cupredoxin-like domain
MRLLGVFLLLFFCAPLAPHAWADDPPAIAISFLGDRFDPAEVPVPANTKVALRVANKTAASMEWESGALHREKIVPAGTTATIFIGPLRPGRYEFFDDFHPNIRGNVVVR